MRILFGVFGEGMGHAMRSRVVLDALVARGHEIQVVVSGRAHDYLSKVSSDRLSVQKIWGLAMVYEDNEVQKWRTLWTNVKGALSGCPTNVRAYFDIAERFQPDVVVSDFETWSTLFGKRHGLPVISIDNMQILNCCEHSPEIFAGAKGAFRLANTVVKAKMPNAFHYHVTTFFYPPVSRPNATLHPPILRPEILAEKGDDGDHLLVYQTASENDALLDVLRRAGRECRIYGLRRGLTEEVVDGRLRFRPFSEAAFVEDLRTAAGVVASGGFTLMGEAVYLRRPMLSVPLKGQAEQILNARYLEKEGYGLAADQISDEVLSGFLARLGDFRHRLGSYTQDGNEDLLNGLDRTLAAAMATRKPEDPA